MAEFYLPFFDESYSVGYLHCLVQVLSLLYLRIFMHLLGFWQRYPLLRCSITVFVSIWYTDKDRELTRKILKVSVKAKTKAIAATIIYFVSMPLAYISVYLAYACFILPLIIFFIPEGIDDEKLAEKIDWKKLTYFLNWILLCLNHFNNHLFCFESPYSSDSFKRCIKLL